MKFWENWFVDYILKRKINFSFKKNKRKNAGRSSRKMVTASRLFVGAVLVVSYAIETRFCRVRYQSLTYAENAPGKP